MKLGVPKEITPKERRVACSPDTVKAFIALGYEVLVEAGAGTAAGFDNACWQEAGATVVKETALLWQDADILIKVMPPLRDPKAHKNEFSLLHAGQTLVSFIWPAQNPKLLRHCAKTGVNVLAMDSIPRISRAQTMDALSSMANIAGYRAVIEASFQFDRFFTGQVTAAGRIPPARVLVIGAGVAGLSAIGAARSMGAEVYAFDTRPEVREQVESMGARFLTVPIAEDGGGSGGYARAMSEEFLEAERELFFAQCKDTDIIISTALIPGESAPELLTTEMIKTMKTGSVVVDLAAAQGGNCQLTTPGRSITRHGVHIIGYTDLPSRLAGQSSRLYANNVLHLIRDMSQDGALSIDMEDTVIRGATVVKDGELTWPPPPLPTQDSPATPPVPAAEAQAIAQPQQQRPSPWSHTLCPLLLLLAGGSLLYGVGLVAPPSFLQHLTVFVLACFVGYMVIWNVTPSLHTPLMSVTNAVSSIIIIGALVQVAAPGILLTMLALLSILMTSINIAGGFAVTWRMLRMFRK